MKNKILLISIICFTGLIFLYPYKAKTQNCWSVSDSSYYMGFEENETDFSFWTSTSSSTAFWKKYPNYPFKGKYTIGSSNQAYNKSWLFTRCFYLIQDSSYQINFWYRVWDDTYQPQNLKVTVGTNQNTNSIIDTISKITNITNDLINNKYKKAFIKYKPSTSGNYYFGFFAYGATAGAPLRIDEFEVSKYNCKLIKPNLGNDTLICNASSLKLDAGADFVKYQWNTGNPGDTLQTLTVEVTGTYSVSVTDVFGCNAVSTSRVVTVFEFPKDTMLTDPSASVTGLNYYTTICNKDSIKLKILMDNALPGSDYEVKWYWKDDYYTAAFGTGDSVYAKEPGQYYYIMNYLPKGCSQSSAMKFNLDVSYPFSGEKLDSVTVDIASGKNLLKWKKNKYDSSTVYFKIYKESSVSDVYEKIDSVASTDSAYTDLSSDPAVRAERYDIAVIDTCGNESELSGYPHKTIHLTINLGINNTYNLIWSDYSGLYYTSYIIYRDTDSNMGHKELIAEVQKGINSYTDINPVSNKINYYYVSIASPVKKLKPLVKSNVVTTKGVGVAELTIDAADLKIYPNPASERLNVEFLMLNKVMVDIRLMDITGREVAVVLNEERAIGKNNVAFNLGNIDKGIYFMKVSAGGFNIVRKVIKN
ncbi:MAG: T9SS type A sorting domain-containing protein [Bacteroidales bacterium]|nr:T9SS type A sorting domain-containing protein [Bacteroidales bacterium]